MNPIQSPRRRPWRRPMLLALVASLALGLTPVPASATGESSDIAEVEAFLRECTADTGTPGVAYAIVSPRGVERLGTWGHDGDGKPITAATPFLWGSVAKTVTATAVLTLVESGAVELDRPVRHYLPSFTLADTDAARRITVRHLLEQTSGIPEATGATDTFGHRPDPYGQAVAALAEVAPLSTPGSEHHYSSANYVVLGALVAAVSGQSFTAYLREHVLEPWDMRGAVTSARQASAVLPDGHGYVFGQPLPLTPPYDPTGPSYGYLGGNITDLAHFATAYLNDGRFGENQVLNAASVAMMQRGSAPVGDTQRYGLGWRDDTRNADLGVRTLWHAGASPGYQAIVVLLPERDRGLVLLQNVYGVLHDTELVTTGLDAARVLAGGEPTARVNTSTYEALLAVLCAVLIAVLAALGRSGHRLVRPATTRPRRVLGAMAGMVLAGLTVAVAAGVVVPTMAGFSLRLARLYAPDIGWLLTVLVGTGLALSALALLVGARHLRHLRLPRRLRGRERRSVGTSAHGDGQRTRQARVSQQSADRDPLSGGPARAG